MNMLYFGNVQWGRRGTTARVNNTHMCVRSSMRILKKKKEAREKQGKDTLTAYH
jgi:hypothetical protein